MSTEATNVPEVGDKVSWKWGSGNPSGVASEVSAGDVTVTSHRGNEISKHGTEDNPAVHIERSGNDVVKKASELSIEKKGEQNGGSEEKKSERKAEESKEEAKTDEEKPKEQEKEKSTNGNGTASGEKRKVEKKPAAEKEAPEPKKQKTTNGDAVSGEKKKPGRPKGQTGAAKKEKKAPAVGTRKSARVASSD